MTPYTFKGRVEAMASASTDAKDTMRRDIRGEFALEMKASGVTNTDLAATLGITKQAVSNYINGRARFTYPILRHVLWMLDGEDFQGRARAFILASKEDHQQMIRDVAAELDQALKEEGVTQRALSAALGEDFHYMNNLIRGIRPFTHKILERVIWLLDGEKKAEGWR